MLGGVINKRALEGDIGLKKIEWPTAGSLYVTYLLAYTVKASTANIKWDCLDNTILLPYTIYILLLSGKLKRISDTSGLIHLEIQ